MSSPSDSAPADTTKKAARHAENKKKPSSTANILTNLLLIVAIGLVLFAAQQIKEQLERNKEILSRQPEPVVTKERVKPQKKKNNVMCPEATNDMNQCVRKEAKCRSTLKQYQSAEQQFNQLIIDCAKANQANERLNNEMEKDILQMEGNLDDAEVLNL